MSILQTGLVLDCNTSDPLSWDGTGPTITNTVSGSTVNLTLSGTQYSVASDEITIIHSTTGNQQTLLTSGALTIGTVMIYLNRTTQLTDQYLVDARTDISSSFIIMSDGSSTNMGSYWDDGYVNGAISTSLSNDIPLNEYSTMAITSSTLSSGTIRLLNGNGRNMDVLFGRILIYDTVLSAAEIASNHTALTTVAIEGISEIVEGILSVTLKVFPVTGATNYTLSYQSSSETETFVADINSAVSLEEQINIVTTDHSIVYTLTLYVDGVSFQTETFTPLTDELPDYVSDGAILYFNANDPASYTEGSEVLIDTLGSTTTLNTNSGVTTFLNDGGLDFSAADNELNLSEAVTFRTISLWYEKTDSYLANPLFLTTSTGSFLGYLASRAIGAGGYSGGAFFPTATVYIDGVVSDIAVGWNDLPNGELHNIVFMGSADVTGILTINGSGTGTAYTSSMIFHSAIFYDKVLTEAELIQNYNAGNGAVVFPFTDDPSSVYINLTWEEDLTNPYSQVIITDPSLVETTVVNGTTDLQVTASNLTPETSYEIKFFNSPDDVTYTLQTTITSTTLENTAANFSSSEFFDGINMVYDFSTLSSATLSIIGELFDELFTTADVLNISDSTGTTHEASFVNIGSTVNLADSKVFYVPFESTAGTVTFTLSDTTPSVMTYDETTGKITVDGTTYSAGDSFYLDGKLVYVRES